MLKASSDFARFHPRFLAVPRHRVLVSPKASRGSSAVPRGSSYKNIGFVMTPMASVSWFRLRLSAALPWTRTVPSVRHRACDDSIISVSWFRFRLKHMGHTHTHNHGMIVAANPQLMRAQQGAPQTRANRSHTKNDSNYCPMLVNWSAVDFKKLYFLVYRASFVVVYIFLLLRL